MCQHWDMSWLNCTGKMSMPFTLTMKKRFAQPCGLIYHCASEQTVAGSKNEDSMWSNKIALFLDDEWRLGWACFLEIYSLHIVTGIYAAECVFNTFLLIPQWSSTVHCSWIFNQLPNNLPLWRYSVFHWI